MCIRKGRVPVDTRWRMETRPRKVRTDSSEGNSFGRGTELKWQTGGAWRRRLTRTRRRGTFMGRELCLGCGARMKSLHEQLKARQQDGIRALRAGERTTLARAGYPCLHAATQPHLLCAVGQLLVRQRQRPQRPPAVPLYGSRQRGTCRLRERHHALAVVGQRRGAAGQDALGGALGVGQVPYDVPYVLSLYEIAQVCVTNTHMVFVHLGSPCGCEMGHAFHGVQGHRMLSGAPWGRGITPRRRRIPCRNVAFLPGAYAMCVVQHTCTHARPHPTHLAPHDAAGVPHRQHAHHLAVAGVGLGGEGGPKRCADGVQRDRGKRLRGGPAGVRTLHGAACCYLCSSTRPSHPTVVPISQPPTDHAFATLTPAPLTLTQTH